MTSIFPLGDPPPAALAAYWQAIDDGCFGDAAACFSRDALYAAPLVRRGRNRSAHGDDRVGHAPRTIRRRGSCARAARRASLPHRRTRHPCRGVVRDLANEPVSTYVCSVRTAADGLIDRYLTFSCVGARDPLPTDVDRPPNRPTQRRWSVTTWPTSTMAASPPPPPASAQTSCTPTPRISTPGSTTPTGSSSEDDRRCARRSTAGAPRRSITSPSRRSSAARTASSKEPYAVSPTVAPAASSPACHSPQMARSVGTSASTANQQFHCTRDDSSREQVTPPHRTAFAATERTHADPDRARRTTVQRIRFHVFSS